MFDEQQKRPERAPQPQFSSVPEGKPTPPRTPKPAAAATAASASASASNDKAKKKKQEEKNLDIDEHLMTIEEVCDRYGVTLDQLRPADSHGLNGDRAAQLLEQYGPNVLTPPKRKHPILVYFGFLLALFNVLLMVAGVLVYILYGINPDENEANLYLGAILFVVAFANAFIEFYQHQKSAAILQSFLNMIPQKCYAIREGKLNQQEAATIVPGDVVFVRMGDKVPADLRIFASSDLKVDNSSLTGESEPQARTKDNDHKNPLEATNVAFNGTLVVAGEGYGVAIRTGDHTVLGQIAGMTAGEKSNRSPLSVEIDRFVKIIASIAAMSAVIFFIVGMVLHDADVSFCLNFAIGVCVSWVPEGLPATMTMLLTIAAKRMASRNVLVKDLQGVETLGAITLLATDKTGTLTRNQMTVTYIWSSQNFYSALRGLQDDSSPLTPEAPGIPEVLHISTLCSRAKFDRTDVPIEERQVLADATEAGLIRFAGRHLEHFDDMQNIYPKVFEIPFNSDNKWALTIHRKKHANGELTLYIKGAPERVLRLCSSILSNDGSEPLTATHQEKYNEIYEYMASKGHRVLAFAQLLLPGDAYPADYEFSKDPCNYPTGDYCFVGLASLEDPPKHGVREAIGRCRAAGVQVMMVTGDHPLTAEAIGRKINLMLSETKPQVAKRLGRPIESIEEHEYQAIVIHGEQIDTFTDEDWDRVFSKNEIIFARTSPRHKLEIVRHAQSLGHIVGVTGDGVNDSPALKKADLGIAMNISGSDVSKEAAAMILLDDNFASTVNGIEEGRLIFTNLKKSIQYTITHSMPEVYASLLYIIVPLPLPLPAILILVVDLGFEMFMALSYAWEKPETKQGLMKMPPRKPVTPSSVERLRRRQARQLQGRVDEESGEVIAPTRGARLRHAIGQFFTAAWWREWREPTEEEVLVDANVLSWAYLEVGTIETIGSLVAYFVALNHHGISPSLARSAANEESVTYFMKKSPPLDLGNGRSLNADEQMEALAQAQTCYYMALMIMQVFNLFACKCRIRLPFGRYMFANHASFYGLIGGFFIGAFVSYVPFMNVAFGTSYKTPVYLHLIGMAFGVFIIFYATVRMLIRRKSRPIRWNPEISGLQMHPTAYSVGSTKN
ncbi:hypothetical protein SYNPS1DRAFT_15649 [Syncephalis pseudoplumigaleata]|uniref:Cation-transporting P-type ATPase N-terminal domain-containing protein n=1 Tax=Syncephalis pseudoplumigaleata TaxID=1712513 RepID=A0A4P9Z1Y8_9FUNG|nr:hypothetical protein SYNPS1DRAFT_15649 [Syncephalis pseudoplumigaleata]|eukprot:RKP25450.1 hypothetical protein SYNPS1DRAFT_15649 [Syncephalis pseudoplumigaleata]